MSFLEVLRTLSFWAKDQLGQPLLLSDLPDAVVAILKGAVIAVVANAVTAPRGVNPDFRALLADLGVTSGKAQTLVANPSGLGQNLNTLLGPDAVHELNTVFANPKQYYKYFSTIRVPDLSVPPTVMAKVNAERQRVRALTRQDFAAMLATVKAAQANFADVVGAGDPTFNATYNRVPLAATKTSPSDDDWEVVFQLNAVTMELNRLAAYNNLSAVPTNPMDFAAGFFASTAIPFRSYPGKFIVPFPYGASLEALAAKYLGSPDRWMEIVVLNNLRDPYVDEQGFDVPLLTNGASNQVTVASALNLEVNQLVYVHAQNQTRMQAHILSIQAVNSAGSYYVLTLDVGGMSAYTTAAGASLHTWLPGTVNSQKTLYIPSRTAPSAPEYDTQEPPGLTVFQNYFNQGGVDLLLTTGGDLVLTPDGDCRLAVGLTNLIQTVRLALATPKGSLVRHPGYGFPRIVGQSIADVPAQTLLAAARSLLAGDSRFTGVSSLAVNIAGPVAKLVLGIDVAGSNQTLPVSFDVR